MLFFTANLISKEYQPILKEGSFWDIETIQQGFGGHNYLKRIQVDGEIEINNKRYTKLKQTTIIDSNKNTFNISPPYFINSSKFKKIKDICLREDVNEKILYIYYIDTGIKKITSNSNTEIDLSTFKKGIYISLKYLIKRVQKNKNSLKYNPKLFLLIL